MVLQGISGATLQQVDDQRVSHENIRNQASQGDEGGIMELVCKIHPYALGLFAVITSSLIVSTIPALLIGGITILVSQAVQKGDTSGNLYRPYGTWYERLVNSIFSFLFVSRPRPQYPIPSPGQFSPFSYPYYMPAYNPYYPVPPMEGYRPIPIWNWNNSGSQSNEATPSVPQGYPPGEEG